MAVKRYTLKNRRNPLGFANEMRSKFNENLIPDYSRDPRNLGYGKDKYNINGIAVDVDINDSLAILIVGEDKHEIGKLRKDISTKTGFEITIDRFQTKYWSNR